MKSITRYFVADFETTVYEGQTDTQVWAAALVELSAPDEQSSVKIFNSLVSFLDYIDKMLYSDNLIIYFHNLRFDGSFILHHILNSDYWSINADQTYEGKVFNKEEAYSMPDGTYRYNITDKGLWYTIKLQNHKHNVEFRDSLKLLPFKVSQLGRDFKLKHQKLEMEYEGYRYPGCEITEEEKAYIANDVLVVKEALNFMFSQGHDKLTIGSCCLAEYKKQYKKKEWNKLFPNLYEDLYYDGLSAGEWIRKTYHGGWCYVVPEKAGREFGMGTTCDVNSLYPSMMHSDSGNKYPVGSGTYWVGDIPREALQDDHYYFVHIKTRFYIKEGMLPTIQIKGNPLYYSREWLKTSDVRGKDGHYYAFYVDDHNNPQPALADLYLTMTDWELLQEHYNLVDLEVIDGFYFQTKIGLFDNYIDKYAEIKQNSKGAMRQLAKLFLNNLYGKFASSPDSSYKIEFLNDNNELRSYTMEAADKLPGYIPIGSAITSYARRFTIKAAQANYHGPNKPGFIYADTDSIHCDLPSDQIVGAPKHPTKFNHWKYEASWDWAKFVRAKTYIEHVYAEDEEPIDNPYYNVKCAGMSDHVKNLFLYSVEQNVSRETFEKLDPDEQEFVKEQRTFEDFKVGLRIPGMLKAKNIKGGVLLCKGDYCMRETIRI